MTQDSGLLRALRRAVAIGGGLALLGIMLTSMDPDAYFYYSFEDKADWTHPTGRVLLICFFTVVEAAITYLVFLPRRPRQRIWHRGFLALLVLAPWVVVLALPIMHAPTYYWLHFLSLFIMNLLLACAVTVSISANVADYLGEGLSAR